MALQLEGQESGGISIALVAKHKRKDQLIDKILIKGFDFSDRSVKLLPHRAPLSDFCTTTRPAIIPISAFHFNSLIQELKFHPSLFFFPLSSSSSCLTLSLKTQDAPSLPV